MGYDMIESATPCVVTVSKPLYDPRYATVKNKMAARKKAIDEITDITLKTDTITVKNTYERPKRQSGVKIVGKPVEEAVVEAMGLIKDAKVL
jgi:electron transfer flavoprotein beta subunit